jgi:3-methyladenine DNA glycosylase AlkD
LHDLLADVRRRLESLAGASVPEVRAARRGVSARLAGESGERVIETAIALVREGLPVGRFFAYELVQHHREAPSALRLRDVEALGEGMASWGDVDAFAAYVAGPAWREGRVSDAAVRRWAASPDRWWRRAALASSVPLNNRARGSTAPHGDAPRTLDVCTRLIGDRDDMVVKALSCALRELAKRDPAAVRAFLSEHRARLAARVVRETENKLRTGLKVPGSRGYR